jgi:hypothetical protein
MERKQIVYLKGTIGDDGLLTVSTDRDSLFPKQFAECINALKFNVLECKFPAEKITIKTHDVLTGRNIVDGSIVDTYATIPEHDEMRIAVQLWEEVPGLDNISIGTMNLGVKADENGNVYVGCGWYRKGEKPAATTAPASNAAKF